MSLVQSARGQTNCMCRDQDRAGKRTVKVKRCQRLVDLQRLGKCRRTIGANIVVCMLFLGGGGKKKVVGEAPDMARYTGQSAESTALCLYSKA